MRSGLLALTLAAILLTPAVATAVPALDGEFPVTGKPAQLVQGPNGNVWFVMEGGGKEFGQIAPDGTVTEYDTTGGELPRDITSVGGRLWLSYDDGIVEVDPASPSTTTAHSVAQVNTARGIAADGDGDLWVVDDFDGTIVEISQAGTFKNDIPGEAINATQPSGRGIALGSDGKLYWADFAGGGIQVSDPAADSSQSYEVSAGTPQEVAPGPAGQLVFSSPNGIIARIATADGAIQETPDPMSDPFGAVFANDQAYWFAEFTTDSVGRLTPDGTLTRPIQFSSDADPRHITTGANNTLWVSLEDLGAVQGPRIARITGVEPPPPPPDPDPTPSDPGPTTLPGPGPGPTGPPAADTLAPTLGAASMRPLVFRIGQRSVIRFTLSENATILLRLQRIRPGRRLGRRCVRPRRAPRGARCRRLVPAGSLTRAGTSGANAIVFRGLVGQRRLRPGAYRLVIVARDAAGNQSTPRSLTFRLRRARR